jgi:prepilin-type N-terminal cleavage/methylation domain-containing protein
MMKKAFTLLELVFAIVVIGILAAVIIPNTNRDTLQEAAIQLVSHIRYTQHLAMIDDKFDSTDDEWYKKRWQIIFGRSNYTDNKVAYSIFSDSATASTANPNLSEFAIDPSNSSKFLTGGYSGTLYTSDVRANKKMNLGLSYDIYTITLSGGCKGQRIVFDHLGRPIEDSVITYTASYKSGKLIQSACIITLKSLTEGDANISIEPETGYAHIQ